jgi:hypothetical protein
MLLLESYVKLNFGYSRKLPHKRLTRQAFLALTKKRIPEPDIKTWSQVSKS